MSLTVRDVMSRRVHTVRDDDDVQLAAQLMLWNGIRHVPVLRDGEVVGVVSDHDVALRSTLAPGSKSSRPLSARQVMHVPAETVAPGELFEHAAARMMEKKIGCLPVVENGELVGILTITDLLARIARLALTREEPLDRTASSAMTPSPDCASPGEPLSRAASRMIERGIRHLPVVDEAGRVIGMLSDRDVRTLLGDPVAALRRRRAPIGEDLTVGSAMTPDPARVAGDAPLSDALAILVDRRVGALPVVNGAGALVGILSYLDVLRALGPEPARVDSVTTAAESPQPR